MRHEILTESRIDNSNVVDFSGKLSLSTLFPAAKFVAATDIEFEQVADESRSCGRGDLVVYRIGTDDPLRVAADAMARGAAGILTEQLLPCPLPQCIVGDTEIALAQIAASQMDRPDRKLLTIGVTGSAGKTTTALLVASLLRSSGYRASFQTDLGECDGIIQKTSKDSAPVNRDLVRWIDESVDAGAQAAIVEISDDRARQGGYDAIEFDVLIVTGGSVANRDFGPATIQCALDTLAPDGVVIAPAEDKKALRLIRDADAKLLTYSVGKAADVTAKILDQSGGMTTLMVTHRRTTAVMETPLCGAANTANHLAATLMGLLLGHPVEEIVENLSKLREVPGRGQRLIEFNQATLVIDAAGSPERAEKVLRSERAMKGAGRLWCVLAVDCHVAGIDLSRYGSLLEKHSDHALVTSTSNGKTGFLSASHAVLDGVKECGLLRLVADRRRAIQWALSQAGANDTILFLTGESDRTAHGQRSDVDQIKSWVRQARSADADDSSPSNSTIEGRDASTALKIFQG